ncbi:hypothetical protein EQP49_14040 [Yersinia sp. 2105 StPb PI]|nr:hypothetical protein CBW53_19020 [Yersinia frederiksenii]RXA95507.1 hypothetical protein EQP49_14040 [Yersinia sp. 2105 StPb PI]
MFNLYTLFLRSAFFTTGQSLTILRYVFRDLNHKISKLTPFSNYLLRVIIINIKKVIIHDVNTPLTPQGINNNDAFNR